MRQAVTAEEAEVFAEIAEKKTDPPRPSAKTSASSAVKRDVSQSHIHSLGHALGIHFAAKVEIQFLELARHRFKQQTLFF